MSYKVDYNTLAIMEDKTVGKVSQGYGTVYTDTPIPKITELLNKHLACKKRVGIVTSIEKVKGECI